MNLGANIVNLYYLGRLKISGAQEKSIGEA